MALETLNSPMIAQPTVRFFAATARSFKTGKRSNKRTRPRNYAEEEYLAMCLVKLARGSAGVVRPASPTVNVVKYSTSREEKSLLTTTDVKKVEEPSLNSVCNKSFPSHQALGGDKASHRPKPPTAVVDDRNLKNGKSSSGGRVHKCYVCDEIFPTGQALGGHMRKHYQGVTGVSTKNRSSDESAAAKSPNNDGGVTISTAGVVRDFDLNVALTDLCCDEVESAFM